MSKHTPGPWFVYDRGIGFEVQDANGRQINDSFRETFTKEDAELISAAPELLEACEWALNYIDTFTHKDAPKVCKSLKAALAKARGETSPPPNHDIMLGKPNPLSGAW